eukprot:SAG31_NODE_1215_length_9335_cov_5.846470_10_plen_194_part_00
MRISAPSMRALLVLVFAAVREPTLAYEVVWNSWYPSECRKHGDTTTATDFQKFGISVNSDLQPGIPSLPPQPSSNDTGRAADKIVLLYENFGLYPAIGAHAGSNSSGTSLFMCDQQQRVAGQPHWCNGGVPQRTNLTAHASKIRSDIETAIPDPDWDGLAFIDYESWQPICERRYFLVFVPTIREIRDFYREM